MRHGSLFSGIGGFDLASEWMGWENVFHCEWNEFGQKVLKYYWPNAISYGDITKTDFREWRDRIDILTGSFPCQPFSVAGKRGGTDDDRYLWPEMLRTIEEIRPEWIVAENVAGLFTILEPESLSEVERKEIWLFCEDETYENNSVIERVQRRVISKIIEEIGAKGYLLPTLEDGTPIVLCIPACAVNAPHRRDRIWFVAHAQHGRNRNRSERIQGSSEEKRMEQQHEVYKSKFANQIWESVINDPINGGYRNNRGQGSEKNEISGISRETLCSRVSDRANSIINSDTSDKGLQRSQNGRKPDCIRTEKKQQSDRPFCTTWEMFPTQPPLCSRNDGISTELDGITFSKWRNESIKAYGNAIVPQVAYQIFKAIEQAHNN